MAFVNLLQAVYPVGSVWLSTTNVSPASIVGGTWQQVNDRFIRTGASATQTGGSDTISWTYGLDWLSYYYAPSAFNQGNEDFFGLWDENSDRFVSGNRVTLEAMASTRNSSLANNFTTTTAGSAHRGTTTTITKSLLPSYYTICMWIRTA